MLPFVLLFFELRKQRLKGAVVYLVPYGSYDGCLFGVRTAVVGIPDPVNFSGNLMESLLTAALRLQPTCDYCFYHILSVSFIPPGSSPPLQVDLIVTATICLLLAMRSGD